MQWRIDWWRTQTRATIYNDIKRFATKTNELSLKSCYGEDSSKWPRQLPINGYHY
jgi:hypothetical protein